MNAVEDIYNVICPASQSFIPLEGSWGELSATSIGDELKEIA